MIIVLKHCPTAYVQQELTDLIGGAPDAVRYFKRNNRTALNNNTTVANTLVASNSGGRSPIL